MAPVARICGSSNIGDSIGMNALPSKGLMVLVCTGSVGGKGIAGFVL